ncbi:gamma-glutamyltransferase [Nakamurella lactea]|uniref:gamma-glutamyltransferase n=1 Tax=Nakamurella lactea TaxID=459515 RepID=UPI00041D8382|nr:gamma-glutamyltransferase [Nakamurella lactea]
MNLSLPASVAAGHPATAAVGRQLLADGGSAADAVAGMVLAGCVAETIFSGLGGGGFATVYSADSRTVECLDFFVAVPGLDGTTAGPARPIDVAFGGVAVPYEVGGPTVAVPGTPAGVAELHSRHGRLPWDRVVRPAEELAGSGVPFPAEHAALLPDIAAAMVLGDGIAAYSDPGTGLLLRAGQRLFHAGLADTLAGYRERGPAAVMSGEWAERLVAAVRADGGALSMQDLSAYQVRTLTVTDTVLGSGRVRVRADDLDSLAGTIAALDVDAVTSGQPGRTLALVRALRAPARRSETTSVAAVDSDGNACAATHSLGLGSGIWTGGVHANSMLGEGELVRGELVAGQRMGSMMVPLVVTDDAGELLLVAGAAGGSRIRPALLQVLVGILLEGRTMTQAVAAPRLSCTSEAVHLEPGFPATVPPAIEAAGDLVVQWEGRRPYFGGVAGVGPGGPAADPRRGGAALLV